MRLISGNIKHSKEDIYPACLLFPSFLLNSRLRVVKAFQTRPHATTLTQC